MQNTSKRTLAISGIILVAALTRILPHPMNFAPLGAMALFGAAYFGNKNWGLLVPMLAWYVSDLVLNNLVYNMEGGFTFFTSGALFIYGSIALIYGLGRLLINKLTVPRILAGSLSASVIFFLLSNLGVWVQGYMYPVTFDGLIMCYTAAIPFFQNTIMGDLFFSGALFLVYERLFGSELKMNSIFSSKK